MKERPILFSGPMVRALLDGHKTQTRRVVKKAPHEEQDWSAVMVHGEACFVQRAHVGTPSETCHFMYGEEGDLPSIRCPYGVPGDRLWIKETWADVNLEGGPGIAYRANGDVRDLMEDESFLDEQEAFNYDDPRLNFGAKGLRFCVWSSDLVGGVEGSWRSSIHMPRWASRLTLEITEVRVERLQDISETDAIAEGLYRSTPDEADRDWFAQSKEEDFGRPPTEDEWKDFNAGVWMVPGVPQGWGLRKADRQQDTWGPTPEFCYRLLWEHIKGADSWAANPWVWAVTFRILENGE